MNPHHRTVRPRPILLALAPITVLLVAPRAEAQFDSQADRWVEYGKIGSRVEYIDSASIRSPEAGVVQAWFLFSAVPPTSDEHASSDRLLQLVRFRCNEHRWAIMLHRSYEAGRLSVSFDNTEPEWDFAPPTSSSERMLNAACSRSPRQR